MKILDVGCGDNKYEGAIGLDYNPRTSADVIHDLGFVDQPHLTKTLKHLVGLTPGQISGVAWTHSVLTERELMLLRLSSS